MTEFPVSPENRMGWIVVWTESRAEKKVASRIAALGIDSWLPTVTENHRWSDRSRRVVLPLFPGYLFARAGIAELSKVLRTPGVLTVVKAGGRPAVLSDAFVAGLRTALENPDFAPEAVATPPKYSVHDEIVVQHGPLVGLRGVVRQLRGAHRLLVWIAEIGRGVAFTVSAELVSPRSSRQLAFDAD